jgi:thioredoxin-related protein
MKNLFLLLFFFYSTSVYSQIEKNTNWEIAKNKAELSNKNILIILTGSDWCKPCIKMEKKVIHTPQFEEYAKNNLEIFEINLPNHFDYSSEIIKEYEYFKNKYQSNALPSLILVDKNGNELGKVSKGVFSIEKVISTLENFKK